MCASRKLDWTHPKSKSKHMQRRKPWSRARHGVVGETDDYNAQSLAYMYMYIVYHLEGGMVM